MMRESPEQFFTASTLYRRQIMRAELIDAYVLMHRRRRLRRRASAGMVAAVLVGASLWLTAHFGSRSPHSAETARGGDVMPLVEVFDRPLVGRSVDFQIIGADRPSLVATVNGAPSLVETISDGDLVRLLEEMGRPAGLIEVGGVVRLTRDVVGAAPDAAPPSGSDAGRPLEPRARAVEAA